MQSKDLPAGLRPGSSTSSEILQRLTAGSLALSMLFAGTAAADDTSADVSTKPGKPKASADEAKTLPNVEVSGSPVQGQNTPQAIDTIGKKEMAEQGVVRLKDALRNVPGITLNAGEGGSHGDSLNLRGLSIPDSFYLDGIRDIGLYQRDVFDVNEIAVMLGPSSVLFGRGSTAGVINQVSKEPLGSPLAAGSLAFGSADLRRGTADFNAPISDTAGLRVNVMDERSGVAERDLVNNNRKGAAVALAFGMDTATRLNLDFLHQDEDNRPDYGIPFIDGAPAKVDRRNYYGLANYDRNTNDVNILTSRFEHDFSPDLSFSNTTRAAHYDFQYILTTPNLANDFTEVPPPGTPLSDILVYRDQPSSGGSQTEYVNRSDLTSRFHTGGVEHVLVTGLELSRESTDLMRYQNGVNDIPPTSLLNPDPFDTPPTPLIPYALPQSRGTDVSAYAVDSMALGPHWDFDAGLRWDRFDSSFSEPLSDSAWKSTDTVLSPRAALIYKPDDTQSYYVSYGTSYNPVIEYLTLAPGDDGLTPEKNSSWEIGAKLRVLGGRLALTGAAFDTRLVNARISDPDDPGLQEGTFDQRVKGIELGAQGYISDRWELYAGYTHLNDRLTASTDPLAIGRFAPNTPNNAFSLWTTFEPTDEWVLGAGLNYMSHRYADTENTAGLPAYTVFNAMASYKVDDHWKLQVNLDNIANKLYFNNVYYSGADENHAVPGAGRTLIFTADFHY
ncbi:MAG TPA: TonB-dependent siderophore receptor [Xanthomonadaceae bacterium]|jgi:catecholate siderophore receptor